MLARTCGPQVRRQCRSYFTVPPIGCVRLTGIRNKNVCIENVCSHFPHPHPADGRAAKYFISENLESRTRINECVIHLYDSLCTERCVLWCATSILPESIYERRMRVHLAASDMNFYFVPFFANFPSCLHSFIHMLIWYVFHELQLNHSHVDLSACMLPWDVSVCVCVIMSLLKKARGIASSETSFPFFLFYFHRRHRFSKRKQFISSACPIASTYARTAHTYIRHMPFSSKI